MPKSKTFYHGHTYGGNPLAAAAALASLDIFEEERTLEMLPAKIARLEGHLSRIARLPHVGDVRQRGLIAAVELVQDVATPAAVPVAGESAALKVARSRDRKAFGSVRWAT